MGGGLLGAATLLLLAATGVLAGTSMRVRGAAALILAAYVLAFAEVVGLVLLLSVFDAVTRASLLAGIVIVFAAVASAWVLAGSPRPPSPPPRGRRSGDAALVALAAVMLLALAYAVALIVGTPPNGWDPLNYHLTRAAFWLQADGVGYIGNAYDERMNFNPPNGEIGFAFVLGITREENLVGFVQFFASLASAIGVYAFARRLGLPRRGAAFGALLFLSLPLVLLQSSGAKNDVIVASFLMAAAVFLIGATRADVALASLATALAVGTKFTAAYGLAVLLCIALVAPPVTRRAPRLAGLVLGAFAGSYWYVVNRYETGAFLGDQAAVPGLTAPFHPRENLLTAYGALVDALDLSGARGADILLYPAVALVLAAALTFSVARWRGALVAAASVCSPLLFLLISKKAGRPGLEHLYDALGEPKGYLAVGDDTASSPTTASDTASWLGPMTPLLAVGASLASLRRLRRRTAGGTCVPMANGDVAPGPSRSTLPCVAFVAALAPLIWFLLVALTLTYNPWLGRFFVFPIALSAALWGVALRHRGMAWAAVTLAALTAGLSLAHYAEKPSGLRLLDRSAPTTSVWTSERWEVQSQHAPEIGPVLRFLDEDVPRKASVALALSANDFGYPAFGPHLDREVELVPFGSAARDITASWLVASRERSAEIDESCWSEAFRSGDGAVFRRRSACPA